jgi:hypothetical protein
LLMMRVTMLCNDCRTVEAFVIFFVCFGLLLPTEVSLYRQT